MAEVRPVVDKRKDTAAAEKEKNTATLSKISNAIKGSEKLDVEGTDLLELLSHLEGELQARDVVIAALKSEQLKKVLYNCYEDGNTAGGAAAASGGGGALSALQRDKTFATDANKIEEELSVSSATAESQIAALHQVIAKQKATAAKMADYLRESERQRSQLVLELQEEKKKHEHDTAQGDDITYELEKDRTRLKQDLEAAVAEKQKLEAAVKDGATKLEEEKAKEKQIVLVLLSDRKKLTKLYLEEKKRSEDLAQMLQDEKSKMDTMATGLEEESKRSLAMEAELEKHLSQFGSERQQLRDKLVADERRYRDLEDALRKARLDVEHFKKQLAEAHRVAMNQAAPPPPYPGNNLVTSGQPLSVSPTPLSTLNRPVAAVAAAVGPAATSQPYATYSNYSTYGQIGGQVINSNPVNSLVGSLTSQAYHPAQQQQQLGVNAAARSIASTHTTSRATQGNPVVRSLSGNITNQTGGGGAQPPQQQPSQQSHNKFHQQTYNNASGGFGHASHPAMMPAPGTLSHLDQEIIPSDIYSQISKPAASGAVKQTNSATSAGGGAASRKPATEISAAAVARKPGLGKGVPPPVPPNKPVVPAKSKDLGKKEGSGTASLGLSALEAGKQSMVTGLQGLKFGISIGGGAADSKMKSEGHAPGLPAKKFFNNIESKS